MAKRVYWRAAVWSGLIGGVVFLAAEMTLVPLFGAGGPWLPVRMIAALALGPGVLQPPAGFDPIVLVTALVVHFGLSTGYSALRAWLVEGRRGPLADGARGMFGLLIYLVNFYGFTALFPWFADARSWISVVTHLAWGLVVPVTYGLIVEREHRKHGNPVPITLSGADPCAHPARVYGGLVGGIHGSARRTGRIPA